MPVKFVVQLSEAGEASLRDLLKGGKAPVRTITRARILLLANQDKADAQIGEALLVGTATVHRVRQRYVEEGLEAALSEKPRPGSLPKLDAKQEARLIALACSDPPEDKPRWTLQMLTDKLIALGVVDHLSDQTVRRTLKKTSSNPGRSSNGAFRK